MEQLCLSIRNIPNGGNVEMQIAGLFDSICIQLELGRSSICLSMTDTYLQKILLWEMERYLK